MSEIRALITYSSNYHKKELCQILPNNIQQRYDFTHSLGQHHWNLFIFLFLRKEDYCTHFHPHPSSLDCQRTAFTVSTRTNQGVGKNLSSIVRVLIRPCSHIDSGNISSGSHGGSGQQRFRCLGVMSCTWPSGGTGGNYYVTGIVTGKKRCFSQHLPRALI